jgi:hypothetical protein
MDVVNFNTKYQEGSERGREGGYIAIYLKPGINLNSIPWIAWISDWFGMNNQRPPDKKQEVSLYLK